MLRKEEEGERDGSAEEQSLLAAASPLPPRLGDPIMVDGQWLGAPAPDSAPQESHDTTKDGSKNSTYALPELTKSTNTLPPPAAEKLVYDDIQSYQNPEVT